MLCPLCNGKTKVSDTRSDKTSVVRRRKCQECKTVIYTTEALDMDASRKLASLINESARRRCKS